MKIKLFATYRDIAKSKELDLPVQEAGTIRRLLNLLIEQIPEFQDELFTETEQLKPYIHIFVNGRNIIHLQGLETTFSTNDEIALIPPVGGG